MLKIIFFFFLFILFTYKLSIHLSAKMKSNDFWDVSSFNNHSYQKGLITFYEEQWNEAHKKDSLKSIPENKPTELPKAKNIIKLRQTPLKELINIDTKSNKNILHLKKSEPSIKTEESVKEITKPFNFISRKKIIISSSLHEAKKEKENKIIEIEKTILKKPLLKEKESKILESVHIQTFPFEDKALDENDLSRISSEMPSLRIRKGSSFKGFHRENFSISTVGLSKDILLECHKKVDKSFDKLSKNESSFGSYLFNREKQISNYLFPVENSEYSLLRKINEKKTEEYEDSLNKFCRKVPNKRQQRNTEICTIQRDLHS